MAELLKKNRYKADVCSILNAKIKNTKVYYGNMLNVTEVIKNIFGRSRYQIDHIKIEEIEKYTPY